MKRLRNANMIYHVDADITYGKYVIKAGSDIIVSFTGKLRISGKGCLLYTSKVIKGKTYIFNADGTMEDGRVILGYNTPNDYKGGAVSKALTAGIYYFNESDGSSNGQMVTGKTTVTKDGEDYYY